MEPVFRCLYQNGRIAENTGPVQRQLLPSAKLMSRLGDTPAGEKCGEGDITPCRSE